MYNVMTLIYNVMLGVHVYVYRYMYMVVYLNYSALRT